MDNTKTFILNKRGEMKAVNPDAWPDEAWTNIGGEIANTSDDNLYATVAPVFRAVNLFANVCSGLPWALVNKAGKDVDISTKWENVVRFMPNPTDLLRRWYMALSMTNTAYGFMENPPNLVYISPSTIKPEVKSGSASENYADAGLKGFTRRIGTQASYYPLDAKRIVYIWRLDHTTELLPSPNTEFRAMANAAGILRFADLYIENYFASGGVKPAIIALKGAVQDSTKKDAESTWDKFIRNVSRLRAKVINADAMTVTPFGDGVKDLQGNNVFEEQCKKIAMAKGMPLSMLLSDYDNYSTAQVYATSWFNNDIMPFCNWMAGILTEQVFSPLGLRMEYRPEMTDEGTEDEAQRSTAFATFGDAFAKYPTADLFIQSAYTFGFELSEEMLAAVNAYYNKPEPKPEPAPVPAPATETTPPEYAQPTQTTNEPPAPAKFVPSLEQLREMELWQTFAFRAFKKSRSLVTLKFETKTLPAEVADTIRVRLGYANSEDEIKAAFGLDDLPASEVVTTDASVLELAKSLNNLAEVYKAVISK